MNINELESFVAVCRTNSFTKAAHERHMTQPGVSRHVQRLERELNVVLFERGNRALTMTPAGERLLAYAQETLARHERFVDSLRSGAQTLSGELRIAASTTPGECMLPTMLAEFTAEHPRIRPEVLIADSRAVIKEVGERRWELGFAGMRHASRTLEYNVIGEDEVVLVVPHSHPFAARHSIDLSELNDQPFIEREGGSGTLHTFQSTLSRLEVPLPRYRVVMVMNSAHATLSAVNNGLGVAIVSSLEFEQHEFQRVYRVRFEGLPMRRQLYMVRPRSRPLSPQADAFAKWVLRRAAGVAPVQQAAN